MKKCKVGVWMVVTGVVLIFGGVIYALFQSTPQKAIPAAIVAWIGMPIVYIGNKIMMKYHCRPEDK